MFNSNFYPLINKPTRNPSFCASTIDHIWTNFTNTCIISGNITHCVADHLPVMQVSQFGKLKKSSIPVIRSFAQSNLLDLKSLLENIDLNDVTEPNDPDKSFSNIYKLVFRQFDKSFPLKQTFMNETKNLAWYDRELRRLMLKKNRIYKKYLCKRDETSDSLYLKIRNPYFHLVKVKKKEFYQKKVLNLRHDFKKTWFCIYNVFGRTKLNGAAGSFCYNGELINNPVDIANKFNDYFSNVAINLVDQLPKPRLPFREYLAPSNPSSIFLYPTTLCNQADN